MTDRRLEYKQIVKAKQELIEQRRMLEKYVEMIPIEGLTFNAEPFDYAMNIFNLCLELYDDVKNSMEFKYEDKRID